MHINKNINGYTGFNEDIHEHYQVGRVKIVCQTNSLDLNSNRELNDRFKKVVEFLGRSCIPDSIDVYFFYEQEKVQIEIIYSNGGRLIFEREKEIFGTVKRRIDIIKEAYKKANIDDVSMNIDFYFNYLG